MLNTEFFLNRLTKALVLKFVTDKQNFRGTYTIRYKNNFEKTLPFKEEDWQENKRFWIYSYLFKTIYFCGYQGFHDYNV